MRIRLAQITPRHAHHASALRRALRACALAGAALLGSNSALARDCVGVVPAGGGNAFWRDVEAGAHRAAQALGIEVYVRGPKDEMHPEVQQQVIEWVIRHGCKALVLAPSLAERAQDVARLKRQGIPTVYIDRDPGGAEVVAVISTDNLAAGREAGQQMSHRLGGHGTVLLLRMQPGVQSTTQREAGFLAAARQGGLTVIDGGYIGSNVGQARLLGQRALAQLPEPPQGLFTPNEATTVAMLSVLQTERRAGRILHIGFDINDSLARALQQRLIAGLVVQNPAQMGYLGVWAAWQAVQGQTPVPSHQDTGVRFLSADMPTLAPPAASTPGR